MIAVGHAASGVRAEFGNQANRYPRIRARSGARNRGPLGQGGRGSLGPLWYHRAPHGPGRMGGPAVAVPDGLDGQDLGPALAEAAGGIGVVPDGPVVHLTDHTKVSSLNVRQKVEGREGRWWVYRERDWKFLQIPLENGRYEEELFDLEADPGEERDLASELPVVVNRLRARLEEMQENWADDMAVAAGEAEPESLDAARIEALRSLGYID